MAILDFRIIIATLLIAGCASQPPVRGTYEQLGGEQGVHVGLVAMRGESQCRGLGIRRVHHVSLPSGWIR